ncbi:extracellular solute-binding protein [Paenibacillus pseudetheri]|uniref:Lipoprotein LipO n=1 Tax=Paenibacillus pseudetheri TaxID=2897682 RepID=A0ABM9BCA7_9BACL|nr:extracellular solute-binding protein [Paenibacillus pseudetheri]CAH1056361.1 Lipoprotein LipO [Paenibacillus pseudetheri]
MKSKKWVVMLLVLVLAVSMIGCGSKEEKKEPSESGSKNQASAPVEISVGTMTFAESPSNDLDSIKQLNEKFNVQLNIDYYPVNSYKEKLNALLASRGLPDVILVEDINDPAFANAAEQGAFWDLTPFIKDYPNLAAYPENVYKNVQFQGKTFGIPRVRPLDGHEALIIRQDWLDKLGLKAPATMDEFASLMAAFTKNDPDGNTKPDTYGLVQSSVSGYMMSMFGAGSTWKETTEGGLEPYWTTEEAKQALAFWSKAYKDGYVIQDLPILKPSQVKDMLIQGKAGMALANVNEAFMFSEELKKVSPNAVLKAYALPSAPDGKKYYDQQVGSYGQFLINKSVSEEKLKKILEVYNETATQEGYNLVAYGVKDVDYTVTADGSITQTDAGKQKAYGTATSAQWISGFFNKYQRAESSGISEEERAYNRSLIDEISKVSVANPGAGLPVSSVWLEKGADWQKKFVDLYTNVVIGKSSMADWDNFVNGLKADASFQKHLSETSESFKAKGK